MKTAIMLICSVFLAGLASVDVWPATLVVPEEYANKEGEGGQLLPRLTEVGRSQQVYSASRFTESIPEGGYITAMTLRMDGERESAYKGSFPDVEIKMGISPSVDPISTLEFSVNIGDRYLTVYGPKALEFNIPASNDPIKPFSFLINLDEPFLYDPREGGLVVDFFFNRGSPDAGLLVDTTSGGLGIFGNIGADRGRASGAFVAEFMITPIPEPSVIAIAAIGAGMVLGAGFWRSNRENP